MREFKNKTARQLFLDSLKIDEAAKKLEEKEVKETGYALDTSAEMYTEAAGLRIIADDIEDGFKSEEDYKNLLEPPDLSAEEVYTFTSEEEESISFICGR